MFSLRMLDCIRSLIVTDGRGKFNYASAAVFKWRQKQPAMTAISEEMLREYRQYCMSIELTLAHSQRYNA